MRCDLKNARGGTVGWASFLGESEHMLNLGHGEEFSVAVKCEMRRSTEETTKVNRAQNVTVLENRV